ncbi:MAG: HD-GYP domain-containing protein [Candidatus Cloacimonadales bacterium]|jgi:putative nucleotidyltransferase with HDIG domain|nr:HD-GYP domain-containing protein [Candidatus Cloacimonadota bacterium]MDX9977984.1 HD-GYP domain-containing protein [Candidatus Cloacimonadales bacterium]
MNIKKILLKDVKLGMCLADNVTDLVGRLIYKKGFYFTSREQVIRLYDEGVKSVSINLTASLIDTRTDSQKAKVVDYSKKEIEMLHSKIENLDTEIEAVKDIYKESQHIIEDLMHNARFGKALNQEIVQKQTVDILNSIKSNELALFSLINLKNFDEYTFTHSLNVSILASAFAWHLKFSEDKLISIGRGAFFHDIGKAKVPMSIINKPNTLNESERRIMQMHPSYGEQIFHHENMKSDIELGIITQHHENYDGSGYPNKLAVNQINKYAAIVAIADFYDAMTTERTYKQEVHPSEVVQIIYSLSAKKFDPRIVNHFIKTVGIYPVGSLVELNNNQIAIVKAFSKENLLKPIVETLIIKNGVLVSTGQLISLIDSELFIKSVYKSDTKLNEQIIIKE